MVPKKIFRLEKSFLEVKTRRKPKRAFFGVQKNSEEKRQTVEKTQKGDLLRRQEFANKIFSLAENFQQQLFSIKRVNKRSNVPKVILTNLLYRPVRFKQSIFGHRFVWNTISSLVMLIMEHRFIEWRTLIHELLPNKNCTHFKVFF